MHTARRNAKPLTYPLPRPLRRPSLLLPRPEDTLKGAAPEPPTAGGKGSCRPPEVKGGSLPAACMTSCPRMAEVTASRVSPPSLLPALIHLDKCKNTSYTDTQYVCREGTLGGGVLKRATMVCIIYRQPHSRTCQYRLPTPCTNGVGRRHHARAPYAPLRKRGACEAQASASRWACVAYMGASEPDPSSTLRFRALRDVERGRIPALPAHHVATTHTSICY